MQAMHSAEMVVAMSAFKHKALEYADVMLPIAPFTETSGSFINTEGHLQSFHGTVKPLGEARPAWKVLRVIANLLGLQGFDYDSSELVRAEIASKDGAVLAPTLNNQVDNIALKNMAPAEGGLQRIGEVPIYQADALVRRAPSLQQTSDAAAPVASVHPSVLEKLQIQTGGMVTVRQNGTHAVLRVVADSNLPPDCVRLATAHPLTAGLGELMGEIEVERA